MVGAAKAGAARQRASGREVDGAQRVATAWSDRPRGRGLGWRQGSGWGSEQRGGPKAWTGVEDSGGSVGKWGVMARRQPWWDLRGPTTPLLLLLSLLSLFPLSREELGDGGGHGWDPGVAAATGPGARIGNGALALCPEPPGVREDGEPGLGVREPVFVGLRGGRQSAQSGRGPPEQPGLGAEYGVKTFGSRGRETGQGPGSLLCWRPEVSSCRRIGPLRRDSLSPEGLSPGVPGPENNPPFPSDLLIRPRGSQPVSSRRNTGRGSSPKVGTTRYCGDQGAGVKAREQRHPERGGQAPGRTALPGPWDLAPDWIQHLAQRGQLPSLVQHRASLGQLPSLRPSACAPEVSSAAASSRSAPGRAPLGPRPGLEPGEYP